MNEQNQIVIYQSEDGKAQLEVKLENETVWLSQKLMADLFDRDYKTISKHIINIFNEGELDKSLTVAKFATVKTN